MHKNAKLFHFVKIAKLAETVKLAKMHNLAK